MATSIMAPGITASFVDVVIASGESAVVGIYADTTGQLPIEGDFRLEHLTPGAANVIGYLTTSSRSILLNAPGTYRVNRPEYVGHPFGVFQDN